MNMKFSKFDIGTLHLRNPIKKKIRGRTIIEQIRPEKSSISAFILSGLVLLLVLQGLAYLSAASGAKGEILGSATSAYSQLSSASKNLADSNFSEAMQLFALSRDNIAIAQKRLNDFKPLQWLTPQGQAAQHLLTGANLLAEAGQKLSSALSVYDEMEISSKGIETSNFNEKMSLNMLELQETNSLVSKAAEQFGSVYGIPGDFDQTLAAAKAQVGALNVLLEKLTRLESLYLSLFSGQKTYLLIFQNYNELRATGGFIGTYGVLKIDNGGINQLKIESIYNLDGRISEQIAAPGPMQPDIKKWGIRDANWFADFPSSAGKLLEFFELGSQTADGVLAFTPQTFEDLLNFIGPIEMPDYGVTLTADNFLDVVQYKTSIDYDKTLNQPKKFLADFAPILLDKLTNLKKDRLFEMFQIFDDNLKQKQILLYSENPEIQKQISSLGFSGELLKTDHDYLNIVNSNLGGTKTDLNVVQTAHLSSKVLSDGGIINTLSIIRNNSSVENNKDYIRILVPLGSELISAEGFDDYNWYASQASGFQTDPDLADWDKGVLDENVFSRVESGKSEFAGWFNTAGGQTKNIKLTYILPFKMQASLGYSLLLQKQDGSRPYLFNGEINLGEFYTKWIGEGVNSDSHNLSFTSESNMDDFWSMVLAR